MDKTQTLIKKLQGLKGDDAARIVQYSEKTRAVSNR